MLLPKLDSLELNLNILHGITLLLLKGSLASHCKLKTLNIASNHLIGLLPPIIANMSGIEELNLCSNSIFGRIHPEVCLLPSHFFSLDLSENLLMGPILLAL